MILWTTTTLQCKDQATKGKEPDESNLQCERKDDEVDEEVDWSIEERKTAGSNPL